MIGQTISHYKILEKLGEGGMGVVYKAEDTLLKRTIALKFLPRGLETHDVERARFLQEAQAASALNHPNVCTIHEIGEHEGQQFIVMEFVDGVTLRTKLAEGGLPVAVATAYAVQIAEALEEAHSKGIVHRDVKAENIMVNAKNQIKVMDFGLAKLKGSLKLTRTTSTVGTLSYMAPEQIQGEVSDARSDIFSFGVVLYEMLTGHLPFRGEHESAMMYSILSEEPEPVSQYRQDLPSELLHVLSRALEKDPEERYQAVHEMLIDLRRVKKESTRIVRPPRADLLSGASPTQATVPPPKPTHKKALWFGLAIVSVVVVGVLALLLLPSRAPTLNPNLSARTLEIPFTEIGIPDLSPDGKWIAFPARVSPGVWSVCFMNVAKGEARRLTTDSAVYMTYAEISPDGSEILYEEDNGLYIVSSLGGTRRKLIARGETPHWRPDGQLIGYIIHGGTQSGKREFWTIRPDGTEGRREFLDAAISGDLSFDWSPDGNSIAWVRPIVSQVSEEIFIRNLRTGEERQLTAFGKRVDELSWASNDQIFFSSDRGGNMNIWMIPARGGEVVQVTKGNGPDIAARASADGRRLLFLEQRMIGNVWIARMDGSNARQLTTENRVMSTPCLSPDNTLICINASSSDQFKSGSELFLLGRDGGGRRQLTAGSRSFSAGIWSPDGKLIAYGAWGSSEPMDSARVYVIEPSSPETPRLVGRGWLGWWIDSERLLVIERTGASARSVLYSLQPPTLIEVSSDSTLRFPMKDGKDTLMRDLRGTSRGWWVIQGKGRDEQPRRRLLAGVAVGGTWPTISLRYLLSRRSDGTLWRIAIPEGKATRLPALFNGLSPTMGACVLSYDDKEIVFIKSRLDCRLGLLENVFE